MNQNAVNSRRSIHVRPCSHLDSHGRIFVAGLNAHNACSGISASLDNADEALRTNHAGTGNVDNSKMKVHRGPRNPHGGFRNIRYRLKTYPEAGGVIDVALEQRTVELEVQPEASAKDCELSEEQGVEHCFRGVVSGTHTEDSEAHSRKRDFTKRQSKPGASLQKRTLQN